MGICYPLWLRLFGFRISVRGFGAFQRKPNNLNPKP